MGNSGKETQGIGNELKRLEREWKALWDENARTGRNTKELAIVSKEIARLENDIAKW